MRGCDLGLSPQFVRRIKPNSQLLGCAFPLFLSLSFFFSQQPHVGGPAHESFFPGQAKGLIHPRDHSVS